MRQFFTLAAPFCLVLGVTPLFAETHFQPWQQSSPAKAPYIFTQQHNMADGAKLPGNVQLVRLGYPLQVQLPGNPALWTFQSGESSGVEYRGRAMVYSPDRIAGTESLLIFDLALSSDVTAGTEGRFTFTTNELPVSLDRVVPGGVYVVHFQVIDPQ